MSSPLASSRLPPLQTQASLWPSLHTTPMIASVADGSATPMPARCRDGRPVDGVPGRARNDRREPAPQPITHRRDRPVALRADDPHDHVMPEFVRDHHWIAILAPTRAGQVDLPAITGCWASVR